MKNFPQISLRYLVPLVIILVAVLLSGFLYLTTRPEFLKTVEERAGQDIQALLNRVQGPIEILLRYDNIDAVKSVIASFGAERGHELMFLANSQGNIIAATNLELLNTHWTGLNEYQDPDLISHALETRATVTRLSANKQRVFGYSSICASQNVQMIRPKDCGFIYYRKNIKNQKALALGNLNKEATRESIGILAAAFIVWIVVYFRLTRRVEQLITTGKNFIQGDQVARARIKGTDELANLGNTLNTMLDKIVTDEYALSKSEARLRAIIETSVEGIITIDDAGTIQSFNSAAEKMFAYAAYEVIGNNVSMLMPLHYQKRHDSYIKNYLASGEAKIIGIGREMEGKRKDDTLFPIWLEVVELFEPRQRFFTGFIRDLTTEKSYLDKATSYESILENSLNEIYIFDADSLIFIRVNKGALENLQYSEDEIVKLTPFDIKPEYSSETFRELIHPLHTGEQDKIVLTTVHQRKDGSRYPVEVHLEFSIYEGKPAFVAIIVDISQRKKAERALRLINATAMQSRDGIFITTRELDEPGPEIVFVNPAFEKITGYSEKEVIGKTPRILQGPKTDKNILKLMRHSLQNDVSWSGETINYRKDGTEFYMQWSIDAIRNEAGEITNWTTVLRDVTEEKKSREKLRLREEEFRLIFNNAPAGIALTDLYGSFLNVNAALCTMLGYSEAELLEMSFIEITHRDDIKKSQDYLAELQDAQLEGYKIEKRYVHKNGAIVYVQVSVAVVHDENQQPAMLIVQIEDVTEIIKAAEYSQKQQEQLAHMDRLSMMGEMAAGIAHEINQPLTAIDSYAQAAKRRIQSDAIDIEKLQDLLEKISKTSVRAGDVITRLRAMVKRQPKKRENININRLIKDSSNIAEVDIHALKFKIDFKLDSATPSVMADTIQIQQVILNLIRNAIDAASKEPDQYKVITISSKLLAAKNRVEVSVKDYGSGLDEESAQQIFNPFYTTKESGMGMGLAICHSIIQEHSGHLWVTRNSDKGTTFHFTLPTALDDKNE